VDGSIYIDDSNSVMGQRARNLLAQKLRVLRMMCGWSQEQLASATGLHRTYISLIERSECNVSLDNLEKIADAFGLSLQELLGVPDAAIFGEKLLAMLSSNSKHEER
jgi:transcriptional regulator with XRE-family HTH domain